MNENKHKKYKLVRTLILYTEREAAFHNFLLYLKNGFLNDVESHQTFSFYEGVTCISRIKFFGITKCTIHKFQPNELLTIKLEIKLFNLLYIGDIYQQYVFKDIYQKTSLTQFFYFTPYVNRNLVIILFLNNYKRYFEVIYNDFKIFCNNK